MDKKNKYLFLPMILMAVLSLCTLSSVCAENRQLSLGAKSGHFTSLTELGFDKKGIIKIDEMRKGARHTGGALSKQVPVYQFFYAGKLIYELNRDGRYAHLGNIWTADLDDNHLKDF